MAFWRPSTMDSWNPFSAYFWTYANLFGSSDQEKVLEAKAKHLKGFESELAQNSPDARLSHITCKLSKKTITIAAITPTGHVFDLAAVERFFDRFEFLPIKGEERLLYIDDFYTFRELTLAIKNHNEFKGRFKNAKTLYLAKATNELGRRSVNWLSKPPQVFICPISKKIITNPVLTRDGKLYDRKAIEQHYKQQGLDGECSSLHDFKEFKKYLKEYRTFLGEVSSRVNNLADGIGQATHKTTSTLGSISHWLFFSWFSNQPGSPPQRIRSENHSKEATQSQRRWLCGL